jgi:hypothetical protein
MNTHHPSTTAANARLLRLKAGVAAAGRAVCGATELRASTKCAGFGVADYSGYTVLGKQASAAACRA